MRPLSFLLYCLSSILLFSGCFLFESPEEELKFTTYLQPVGGNGFDLIEGVVEVEDGYIIAGSVGPRCDVVDAFFGKLEKETGVINKIEVLGEQDQFYEENFKSLTLVGDTLYAMGFAIEKQDPDENGGKCKKEGVPSEYSFGKVTKDFSYSKITTYKDSNGWYAGSDIKKAPSEIGGLLVAGTWNSKFGVMKLKGNSSYSQITSDFLSGVAEKSNSLIVHSLNRVFVVGNGVSEIPFGEVDLYSDEFIEEKFISTVELISVIEEGSADNWSGAKTKVTAITETLDNHLLIVGAIEHPNDFGKALLLKVDLNGTVVAKAAINLGTNGKINDVIKLEIDNSYVITGFATPEPGTINTKNDIFIAKIKEEGNLFSCEWINCFDWLNNNDWASSVIETEDGGFFLGGRTTTADDNGIQTMIVAKTDALGQIKGTPSSANCVCNIIQ